MKENLIKADPLGGIIPQELITGDILRGYGPRRGNLERLLRYWRPIMRKPGGFRRCRLILANHPELYPLNNICAWLHHEVTGVWPNEGCHHPGMRNCRGKLRKLMNWNDSQFSSYIRSGFKKKPKNLMRNAKDLSIEDDEVFFYEYINPSVKSDEQNVVTEEDANHAINVLFDFIEMEKKFIDYLRNDDNWEQVGEGNNGEMKSSPRIKTKSLEEECCG
jgi:hypothetical protein